MHEMVPVFWANFWVSAPSTFLRVRWKQILGERRFDRWLADRVLRRAPFDDGRIEVVDLGHGFKQYEIWVEGTRLTAHPADGLGPTYDLVDDDLLEFDPERYARLIADGSGFSTDLPGHLPIRNVHFVGSGEMGPKRVRWYCAPHSSAEKLQADVAQLADFRGADGDVVLVSVPTLPANGLRESALRKNIVLTEMPTEVSNWMLHPRQYCLRELGVSLGELGKHLARVPLAIDEREKRLFVYGRPIGMKQGAREFDYIEYLARHPGVPVPAAVVREGIRLSPSAEWETSLRMARNGFKKRLSAVFSDAADARAAALAMLPDGGRDGSHLIAISATDVLRWT